jgi:putative heme iron utilization protein
MNTDHKEALVLLARRLAGIDAQEVAMTSVDRLGFHLRLKTQEGVRGARINFPREVNTSSDTRSVLVEMVQQARQR